MTEKTIKCECPCCKALDIRYVQDSTEYFHVDEVREGGDVDLGDLDESFPHDSYHFACVACDAQFVVRDGAFYLTRS